MFFAAPWHSFRPTLSSTPPCPASAGSRGGAHANMHSEPSMPLSSHGLTFTAGTLPIRAPLLYSHPSPAFRLTPPTPLPACLRHSPFAARPANQPNANTQGFRTRPLRALCPMSLPCLSPPLPFPLPCLPTACLFFIRRAAAPPQHSPQPSPQPYVPSPLALAKPRTRTYRLAPSHNRTLQLWSTPNCTAHAATCPAGWHSFKPLIAARSPLPLLCRSPTNPNE